MEQAQPVVSFAGAQLVNYVSLKQRLSTVIVAIRLQLDPTSFQRLVIQEI